MDLYPKSAMERAMTIQEVVLQAMAKKITWWAAAEIIGISDRQMRRWRGRWQRFGWDGLLDQRRRHPSQRRVPVETVERVLQLYREQYPGWNVRHFHEKLGEEHQIQLSYAWVKNGLQQAGLVGRSRKRGVHRKRRARRPQPGMMVLIDGSEHAWFGDQRRPCLLVILDDATSEVYYAQLVEEESTLTVMAALRTVIEQHGLFCSVYSDRASHFWVTLQAGGQVDRTQLTQVGRALRELKIAMIPSYSPQGRGRIERGFRTWQGRLPQELRHRNITTLEAANQFLREHYRAEFNQKFAQPAADSGTAFVALAGQDLERIFTIQQERKVRPDNTEQYQNRELQIEPVSWRATLAGWHVLLLEQLDETLSLPYGPHCV